MTIEEKRRELFEAWAIAEATRREYQFMSRVTARHADDSYATTWVDCAWIGFNAALDAVVIQMPNRFEYSNPDAAGAAIFDCATAIKSTGLGLKVLP